LNILALHDELKFFAEWPAAQCPSDTNVEPLLPQSDRTDSALGLYVRRTLGGTPFSEEL
jgi:hypothetical protein